MENACSGPDRVFAPLAKSSAFRLLWVFILFNHLGEFVDGENDDINNLSSDDDLDVFQPLFFFFESFQSFLKPIEEQKGNR